MRLKIGSKTFNEDLKNLLESVEAETLQRSQNAIPTSLKSLADRREVKVRFMPLPVPGCLAVTQAGFEIFIQTAGDHVDDYTSKFLSGNDRLLPHRVRFTLAHELAHTYFYNTLNKPAAMVTPPDSLDDFDRLENACDLIGNRILLPAKLLKEFTQTNDIHDPAMLRKLADTAAVSARVVIRAIQFSESCLSPYSGIATVELQQGGYKLTELCKGTIFRNVFPKLQKGQWLSDWIKSTEFLPNGGQNSDIRFHRSEQDSKEEMHVFRARFEQAPNPSSRKNLFVTVGQFGKDHDILL